MKTLRFLSAVLTVVLAASRITTGALAAPVGPAGYTADFSVLPAATDWSYLSIAGGAGDVTTPAQVDAAVQAVSAASISLAVSSDAGNPPGASAAAVWSSSGLYLQTRPTGNRVTLLMCTLVNGIGANAAAAEISYRFDKGAAVTEEIEGQRVYYSRSGAVGSWTVIPELSSAAAGTASNRLNVAWPSGGTLYLVWADDNGSGSPDTACLIDNFTVTLTSAVQVPVAITSQPPDQTVDELMPVTFTVAATGNPVPSFQWYKNSASIPNATNASYSIPSTPLSDHNASFYVVAANLVNNQTYLATSRVATLTVNADLIRPVLLSAASSGLRQVVASFSEPLAPASAANVTNYAITGPGGSLTISNAALDSSQTNVLLSVGAMTEGSTYTLTVSGLTDQSAAANAVTPNSQAQFTVMALSPVDIGNPSIGGSVVSAGGGFNLTGGGTNIAGLSDQFFFYYQPVAGPFDLKVRVEGMSLSDVWAKAGLMAREQLTANSRFAMTVATPSGGGLYFLSRSAANASTSSSGQFPVNYPYTWLRLTRTNDNFAGYASLNGQAWVLLGSATITNAATTFYLGMAVCGSTTNGSAAVTAQFREFGPTAAGSIVSSVELPWEPLGPASRNTGLVISEIMYHPKHSNDLEFVEIFNAGLIQEDLTGWRLSGDIDYSFPPNIVLPAGAFLVVARKPALLQQAYGITGVLGPWTGAETNALPDSAGRIRLRNPANAVALEVNYRGALPWPLAADGAGHSLVLARPSYGQDSDKAWLASDRVGGTPGWMESWQPDPMRDVVVNEFLANSDLPSEDFIELYNHSTRPVDLSGAFLSDDRDTNKFRIPVNTVLPAWGFRVFTQTELGFALSSGGERIYLVNSNQNRVIDLVAFNGQAPGVSSGRYPDGGQGVHELTTPTPGSFNSVLLIRDVVINEMMFNPPSDNSDDEYLELYNRSASPVNVGNWRFTDGIDFAFAPNTTIPGHGYLVVAKNRTRLFTKYAHLNPTNTVGDYGGTLDNGGERIALSRPEYVVTTNGQGALVTNLNWIAVDEVDYLDEGRWAQWADGGGSSLELIDPQSDNRIVANWADSDETAKSSWTNVSFTGVLDNLYPRSGAGQLQDEIQVMILGGGEALMDDLLVQVGTNGPNVVSNPNFSSGLTGWLIQGNHVRSTLEPVGPNNPSQCMRLRATAAGDNGANRVECQLSTAMALNQTATIGGRFRWLRGFPIVLLRLHGGAIEAVATLPIPPNVGTPGQPNSRLLANAGPAIDDVSHSPVLPAANQPAVVTARVSDPNGIATVELRYRLDPGTSLSSVAMRDDGAGGDAVAGDGIFSGTIPGVPAGTMVAFRIAATDAAASAGHSLFPQDAPVHECLIRFGEPSLFGNLGLYRLWTTAANYNTWKNRERLSNEPVDGTFVYGNVRVIYNAGARYRGSPFTRPSASDPVGINVNANYIWSFPPDELFLGADELNLDSLEPVNGGYQRDATALREVTSFKMAEQLGLDFSYQRYVHLIINGVTSPARNIPVYSDTQQPNGEYVTMWYPDNDAGDLYKIDDWFEFDDTPGMQANKCANLGNWTTPSPSGLPVKKQARYRWNWEKKFNQGYTDDYSTLFGLDDALNQPANTPDATLIGNLDEVMDVENWMIVAAFGHVIGDWDRYGYSRGKNQFIYQPVGEGFRMLLWDLDFSLGCLGGHGPSQDLFSINLQGENEQNHMPEMKRLYDHPYFRRIYYQALMRIADGPLQDAAFLPTLDARYRALQANNVAITSPYVASGAQSISIPAWIQQRRSYIYGQLTTQTNMTFSMTTSTNITATENVITLAGRAPIMVKTVVVRANGVDYPVTWNSTTTWSFRIPLKTGTNLLVVEPYDLGGNLLSNQVVYASAVFDSIVPDPAGLVLFNELQFNPPVPGAEYVELLNRSDAFTFDLSGWRIDGVDYTFPPGSLIGPRALLLLVRNTPLCLSAYGTNLPIHAEFAGNLRSEGETLSLLKPGAAPGQETVVDRVRYELAAPWPSGVRELGAAVQLVDAAQDNSRVSNWSDGGGWKFYTGTGRGGSPLRIYFPQTTGGEVFIDDLSLIDPATGDDLIVNGDFEAPLGDPWAFVGSGMTNSHVTNLLSHSGNSCLRVIATAGGTGNLLTHPLAGINTSSNYVLSFWYLPTDKAESLVVYVSSNFRPQVGVRPKLGSPGEANDVTVPLPPYPTLWLNEVQPLNVSGVTDNAGQREPWIELHNPGVSPISLAECYLSDNYTNLTQWAFPSDAVINPGQFLVVWADGQPAQSAPGHPHTSFRITNSTGSVALSRSIGGSLQVLDYLNFAAIPADWSYGAVPDGQPFYRFDLYHPTAGAANDSAPPPVVVSINEWMAANSAPGGWPDPADGDYDDWFELYNPGASPVDLGGYYLTDNLTNRFQFRIPSGYTVPAGGYLLVWADNEDGQNQSNRLDLHVSFALRQAGEAIGLYAADGTAIDTVVFGPQTNNLSEGRYPDGAAGRYFMPVFTPRGPNEIPTQPDQPEIGGVVIVGGQVSFSVRTMAGRRYQAYYQDELGALEWVPLGGERAGTGGPLVITDPDPVSAHGQRFYTVLLLPP